MKTSRLLIGALSAFVLSTSANAVTVDLFTDPAGGQAVADASNGSEPDDAENFSETGSFTSIVGGYRDLKADAISGASGGTCGVADDCTVLRVLNGRLTFNNDTGVTGTGIVQWDGQDNSSDLNHGGLNNENLYAQAGCEEFNAGCDRFVFTVYESDQDFPFLVGIYTDENTFTEFLLAANAAQEGVSDYTSELLFALFDNAQALGLCGTTNPSEGVLAVNCGSNGDADLTDVGAMQVVLNPDGATQTVAVDLEIGGITKTGIVPEPGLIALLGMGFAAGGLVRARRRKSN